MNAGTTLALLCSGQGLQHREMFRLTARLPETRGLFDHASELLGFDPRDAQRMATYPLLGNRAGQILCAIQALAAATALGEAWHANRVVVAGYSVGEVAAWGVVQGWSSGDALDCVARRAEAMDASTAPGDGLVSVRGLSQRAMQDVCSESGAAIAIVNPGDAFVVGGSQEALAAVAAQAPAQAVGARVTRLQVAVASHTSKLAPAARQFRVDLESVHTSAPLFGMRILSGVDGLPVTKLSIGLDKLAAQVSQTVRWDACLQGCIEAGATAFLELGPGRALAEMVTREYPGVIARSLEDFSSLDGARDWLARR